MKVFRVTDVVVNDYNDNFMGGSERSEMICLGMIDVLVTIESEEDTHYLTFQTSDTYDSGFGFPTELEFNDVHGDANLQVSRSGFIGTTPYDEFIEEVKEEAKVQERWEQYIRLNYSERYRDWDENCISRTTEAEEIKSAFEACKEGNLYELQDFVKNDGNVSIPFLYENGDELYFHEVAAANGHLEIIKCLVEESNYDLDLTINENLTVRLAAASGHLDVVKYLVEESGQDVDVTEKDDDAVRLAAENGHLDVVKYLAEEIEQSVDLTARYNKAVRLAAENGRLDVVKYLVEKSGQNVDVTAWDNDAVRLAARNGHLDIVKYLVEESGQRVDVTAWDNDAVRLAAKYGHLDVVKYLASICYEIPDKDIQNAAVKDLIIMCREINTDFSFQTLQKLTNLLAKSSNQFDQQFMHEVLCSKYIRRALRSGVITTVEEIEEACKQIHEQSHQAQRRI